MCRQAELAEFGHGFALVLQQALGQVPAAVQGANQLAFRHFHGVKEHLAKRRFTADQIYRRNTHTGAFHVQHNQADARVFTGAAIGSDQGVHPVRLVAVGGPDLAAIHHKVIALIAGSGFQTGQIRAGIGLGKPLTPANLATGHRGQQVEFLLFSTELQQHGAQHPYAQIDLRRAAFKAAQFAFQNGVIFRTQAATAIGLRPVGAEPAFVTHALEPQLGVSIGKLDVTASPDQLPFRDGFTLRWRAIGLKPTAGLLSELFNRAHVISFRMVIP